MIYPSPDKLDSLEDGKYALVIVVAKRARQIKDGARIFVPKESTNPLTTALEEIAEDKIIMKQTLIHDDVPSSAPITPVLTGLLDAEFDPEAAAHLSDLLDIGEDNSGHEDDAAPVDQVIYTDGVEDDTDGYSMGGSAEGGSGTGLDGDDDNGGDDDVDGEAL
jgi:DNA-directed RNA polymerase subunit omega